MRNVGVDTEANVPYKAIGDRGCRDSLRKYENRIMKWKRIEPSEHKLREAIYEHGPILASFSVDREFFSYEGGVFNSDSSATPNHAALIVGYGQEGGHPVWFIKNSWGESWGQKGFMSIARNDNSSDNSHGAYAIISVF
jgi:C1A family cysteine protease